MNRGRSRRETDLDVTGRGLGLEVGSDGSESEVDHFVKMYVRFLTCSTVKDVDDQARSRWMGGRDILGVACYLYRPAVDCQLRPELTITPSGNGSKYRSDANDFDRRM